MMCALGAAAAEAYACYYDYTLTFYYDNLRSSRLGTTYDLNTGSNDTGWDTDGTKSNVFKVVFDPSFADARPTTTYDWFVDMGNLQSITGMKEYLNTSEVTNMASMFHNCKGLTSLDLSGFNTSKVTDMHSMFNGSNLQTIYVGGGWSTAAVTTSFYMFEYCYSLVGGKGTTYDSSHTNKDYAHIDGGPSNPGYFSAAPSFTRGDVNDDGNINIADVTALINYLLSLNPAGVNLQGADTSLNGIINITDVTFLINYLLSHSWP